MNSIDLIDYATHSQKVPQKILNAQLTKKTKIPHWKILASYAIDFYLVVASTYAMAMLFQLTAQNMFFTQAMKNFLNTNIVSDLPLLAMPVTLTSYFFFCYFFNQGQTVGAWKMKLRLEMPYMDAEESFQWAIYSSATLVTCGLLLRASQITPPIKAHDHLYHELLADKIVSPFNLFDHIETKKEDVAEEHYLIAA
jgi:hypothetical protein